MRAVVLLCLAASSAQAGDLCARGRAHRGKVVELDLANAELRDVLRLLTDTANLNLVVGEAVTGKVTLKLKGVPWDAAACTLASLHHLKLELTDSILLVTPAT